MQLPGNPLNSNFGMSTYANLSTLVEDNFSLVDENTMIWEGELPFVEGNVFPTKAIQDRANRIKTNDALYRNDRFYEIFNTLFNFNDSQVDVVTKQPILRTTPNLPDYALITDTWVDNLASKEPSIDGTDEVRISGVSSLLGATNFGSTYQNIIRASIFKYGNQPVRIDCAEGGNPRVVTMPTKTWIPFVSPSDPTSIEVNCFFNIYEKQKQKYIEFILYHETVEKAGLIEKYTFYYGVGRGKNQSKTIGAQVDYQKDEAFGGAGVSPIVVFTGVNDGNSPYGIDQYSRWEASIVSSIKAFETVLVLLERSKEMIRVVPDSVTHRDEATGQTHYRQMGAIGIDTEEGRDASNYVHYAVPTIPLQQAIEAWKETMTRVSRDTDLAYSIFDTRILGANATGKAVKASMAKTETKGNTYITLLNYPTKQLISKMALAGGYDLPLNDFSVYINNGFIRDDETVVEMVHKRLGNGQASISLAKAIAIIDNIPMSEAQKYADELLGHPVQDTKDVEDTNAGGNSAVSNIRLEVSSQDTGINATPHKEPNKFYTHSDGDHHL